jgi:hypothetical protein
LRKIASTLIVILVGLTASIVAASLILTLLLPSLLRQFACKPYGLRCAIGQGKIHPRLNLTADLVLRNVTILESDGSAEILRAKRLTVSLDLPTFIRAGGGIPAEVRFDSPELRLRALPDGRWNVMALAETVRQHLRPTARITPMQLPRIVLTKGEIGFGARRVSALDITLHPKQAPLLLGIQVKGAVEGRAFMANGVISESLEGEFRLEGRGIDTDGATQAWTPRATVRARLDVSARELHVSEWIVEDRGVMARGTVAIRYAGLPPAYELTLVSSQIDLAALAEKLPLPHPAELSGQVQIEPITLKGHWPRPPVARIMATLTGGGFHLPKHAVRLTGLKGACRLEHADGLLRLHAEFRGEALEVLGQRHASPVLRARVGIDPGDGNVAIEEASGSILAARIDAKGHIRRWGSDGFELWTTELVVKPDMLERFFARAGRGATIKAIREPTIHLRWLGKGRPWSVAIASRSTDVAASTRGPVFATLEGTNITLEGTGASWENLQGTLVTRKAELAGRTISDFIMTFQIDPTSIRVPELRFAAAGGAVHGRAVLSRPSPLNDSRFTLSANNLRVRQFLPAPGQSTATSGVTLDAEISAAVSHGKASATIDLPPAVSHQLARLLHGAEQTNSSPRSAGDHLILRAQGDVRTGQGLEASGSVAVEGIRTLLAGEDADARAQPVAVSVTLRDGLATITARELTFTAQELAPFLSRLAGRRLRGKTGGLVVSASANVGASRPPSVPGEIAIKELAFDLIRHDATPAPLVRGLNGSVRFALDRGVLSIEESVLRASDGLTLTIGGGLPISRTHDRPSRFRVALPWTEMSSLRTVFAALTPAALADVRLSGQLRADLELIDQKYRGSVAIRSGGMESSVLRVDGISGVIPLSGGIGQAPPRDGAVVVERLGSRFLSAEAYEQIRTSVLDRPWDTENPDSLKVALLRYGPIEVRDLQASFAQSGDGVVAHRFAFQVWGGRGGGRGTIDPLRGRVALTLLVDGLSLQAICDAFPVIKGYISGRVNGLAEFSGQRFALDDTQGRARFWAVHSRHERNEISRTLIEKLAGQKIRYFSLFSDDRRYDRGVLDVSLKQGDLVFHELDISHTTLGIKDLEVKVSPDFNRISATDLLETIIEAAERIQATAKPQP